MRVKKFILPTLTMVIIASQLMGCSAATPSELQTMLQQGQQIEIEIATPISEEQGEEKTLDWIQLDQLTTYDTFRKQLDDIMQITSFGNGSKNGICYINLEGMQEGNNTLYNAMMNRKFIANFLENDTATLKTQQIMDSVYVDTDEGDYMAAAINAYWNLLPDAEPNYFNGGSTLTRIEAMTLLARANTSVAENIGDSTFESQVGNAKYSEFASLVANDSYLTLADKSLNEKTANGTITRGEYIYMLVSNVFGTDRISSADTKKAQFNDCKSAGDIASQQKLSEEDTSKDYYDSAELKFTLDNPDSGCPDKMYQALVAAQELGIIGSDTRWDEGLTKSEAIQLYLDTLQAYTKLNGYPIDQTAGTGDTSGTVVEQQKPVEETVTIGGSMTGADIDENDEYNQQINEADKEREETDKELGQSTGIEIVEELDKTMYAQQNCNARSGDGTNYDKAASIEKGAQLHVTGRTSNDWYRVEWGDGVVYIAGSLLGDTAPTTQKPSTSGNTGSTGGSTQQPSGGGNGQGSQPSTGGGSITQDQIDSIFGPGSTGGATEGGPGAGKLP